MRALTLAALLLVAACSTGPAGSGTPPSPDSTTASPARPTASPAVTPVPSPSASPSASLVSSTSYTEDDEAIATLIRTASEAAIPQLKGLNRSDPSSLEALFLPLGEWIESQRTAISAYTPTTCTAAAVDLFHDGLDQYDDIREKFMAWRDWGANGHAFPPGAPNVAVAAFEEAQVELDAHCPGT